MLYQWGSWRTYSAFLKKLETEKADSLADAATPRPLSPTLTDPLEDILDAEIDEETFNAGPPTSDSPSPERSWGVDVPESSSGWADFVAPEDWGRPLVETTEQVADAAFRYQQAWGVKDGHDQGSVETTEQIEDAAFRYQQSLGKMLGKDEHDQGSVAAWQPEDTPDRLQQEELENPSQSFW